MSINNLHSILNGKWFINENYANSMLPLLYSFLNKPTLAMESNAPSNDHYIIALNGDGKYELMSSTSDLSANNESFVAVISLKNPIYKYNQGCGVRGTKDIAKLMSAYADNKQCKGVVLDIDSGGGQVSGTPEFFDFIINYTKPVVAYTDGYMCSAAYYIASACKHIVANTRADAIGSIGTMVATFNYRGYYESQGIKEIREYASKSTQKNRDFEELLEGKPENYIKNVLDVITDDFHNDVKSARANVNEDVFTGATYNAEKSVELGLVDEIGTLSTAVDKVISLSNLNNSEERMAKSKLDAPNLENILGVNFSEAESDSGLLLTDDQVMVIEQAFAEQNQISEKLQNTEQSLNEANSEIKAVNDAVISALNTAEVEKSTDMTTVEGVEKLSALVAEYGKNAGADTTNSIAGTNQNEGAVNVIGGIDISNAMNN